MKPLTVAQVRTIKHLLEVEENARDLALFSTAIDTMLRSVDLLALTMEDITDHEGRMMNEITVRQVKTGKGVVVALSETTQQALKHWIEESAKVYWDPLFTGRQRDRAITTTQYRRLVKQWVAMARLDPKHYSSHSLRRTKAALIFEYTRNVEVVRELLGQSSVAATSAYLNVGKRKALEIARRFEI